MSFFFLVTSLLLAASTLAARVPGSPYRICDNGLNSSSTIYTFNSGNPTTQDDEFTVQTLQGILAKKQPQIYRYDSNNQAPYPLWLQQTVSLYTNVEINTTFFNDVVGLVSHFASELQGYVLVDLSDNSTNIGTAAAAAMNVISCTTKNQQTAISAGLTLVADLRGKDLAWALSTFNNTANGFSYSNTVTILQLPSEGQGCMSDFSISMKALQWWQDDISDESPLSKQIWGSMNPEFFSMLGWGPDEYNTVTQVSHYGGAVMASNWASNLDFFSQFDIPQFTQASQTVHPYPPLPPTPTSPKHTVCFLMSDGDNIQWILDGMPTEASWFGSSDRGYVPLGFTLSPSLAELAPAIMQYMYTQAANASLPYGSTFVAGVSGVGYFYPDSYSSLSSLAKTASLTNAYMAKADMRIVNILAHGEGFSTNDIPAAYFNAGSTAEGAAEDPPKEEESGGNNIDALFWYNYDDYAGMKGNITFINGKPVIGGRYNLWGSGMSPDPTGPTFKNVTTLIEALLAEPRTPTNSNGYSLIPLHAWSHNVTDARTIMEALQAQGNGEIDVVTPEEFVRRIVAYIPH